MGFLKSLPPDADIPPVFLFSPPEFVRHLLHLHQVVLRDEGALPVKIRELIAAFTCGTLNSPYCFDAHRTVCEVLGWPLETVDTLVRDIESTDFDTRHKSLFRYLKRLILAPSTLHQSDYDQLSDAGWTDKEINLAIIICCLYNFMGRYTLGHGLRLHPEKAEMERRHGEALANGGYIDDLLHLGLKPIVEAA
jgi:alkylhydroperoxidase family enzyme